MFCVCLCPYDGVVSLYSEKKKVVWRCEGLWLYFDLLEGIIYNVKESNLKHVATRNHFFFFFVLEHFLFAKRKKRGIEKLNKKCL